MNRFVVSSIFPELIIILFGVLRAGGSLSYELRRVAVEICFKCFALTLFYRDLL